MGTSFVNIGDKGFWINDSLLELWLRLLSLHIEDPNDLDSTDEQSLKTEIRSNWLLQSRGYFTGCVSVDLDNYIKSSEGIKIIKDAISSLMEALSRSPDMLSGELINLLGIDGSYRHDIETWRLMEVGYAFIDLIDGKLHNKSNNSDFMPGCGDRKHYDI